MATDFLRSLVRITGSDQDPNAFGTGFVCDVYDGHTWILTCNHVLEAVGGAEGVCAARRPARVVGRGEEPVDLALLRIDGFDELAPLSLGLDAKAGAKVTVAGFQRDHPRDEYFTRVLDARLGTRLSFDAGSGVAEKLEAVDLEITSPAGLRPGCSGSPVVNREREVIGIMTKAYAEGRSGRAVSPSALFELDTLSYSTPANPARFEVQPQEVDAYSSGRLKTQIYTCLATRGPWLDVDLRRITFLDSSGLGVFIGCLKRARQAGGDLRLVCDSLRILRIFEITRLTKIFTILKD